MGSLKWLRPIAAGVAALVPVIVVACGDDDVNDGGTSMFDSGSDVEQPPPVTTSTGFPIDTPDVLVPPFDGGQAPACSKQEVTAVPGKRPVDIIFAIDNSESMSEEIGEVEKQINDNFAKIIEESGTDYHVIMLSQHGTHAPGNTLQKICVKAPLSGTSCNPVPAKPVDTDHFMHHSVTINSNDALCRIIDTVNAVDEFGRHPGGWATFLRPDAFKVITVITDDQVNTTCHGVKLDDNTNSASAGTNTAAKFDGYFLANFPEFGTATHRNYLFHSIVGVAPFQPSDPTKPYPPEAPIAVDTCTPSAIAPGTGYQALSRLTGGLRYPTCGLDYTTMFQQMAKAVIDRATIECDFAYPANPVGGRINPATAVVHYESAPARDGGADGGGAGDAAADAGPVVSKDFAQAPNLAACTAGKFYIENPPPADAGVTSFDAGATRIKLCPDACLAIQGDANAKVSLRFSCFPKDVQ